MQKTQFSFLLSGDQIYFDFLSLTNHPKKKKKMKSWKIHILGKSRYSLYFAKFHTEILWWKSIHCEPTSHNCHTEIPCELSEQHRCIIHSQHCSLCNTKINSLIPILIVHCLQVWRMMRESAFHSPRIRWPYPMPCNIFCKGGIEILDLCSFRIPSQDEKSDQITSAFSKFPSISQTLRYSVGQTFVTDLTFLVWVSRLHFIHPFPKNESKNKK